jgi:hypothetical protein
MTGKDRGKQGEVMRVVRDQRFPRVFVQGVNMVSARAVTAFNSNGSDSSSGGNGSSRGPELRVTPCRCCVPVCADHSQDPQAHQPHGPDCPRLQCADGGACMPVSVCRGVDVTAGCCLECVLAGRSRVLQLCWHTQWSLLHEHVSAGWASVCASSPAMPYAVSTCVNIPTQRATTSASLLHPLPPNRGHVYCLSALMNLCVSTCPGRRCPSSLCHETGTCALLQRHAGGPPKQKACAHLLHV